MDLPISASTQPVPAWIAIVGEKFAMLRYGVIQLAMSDGHVTGIERAKKSRLPLTRGSPGCEKLLLSVHPGGSHPSSALA
jgi:hypothetical protein